MSADQNFTTNVRGITVLRGIRAIDFDPNLEIQIAQDGTLVLPDDINPNSVREFYANLSEAGVEPMPEGATKDDPIEYRLSPFVLCG